MIELALATRNEGKIKEFREMMKDLPVRLLSINDFPDFPETVEDGKTFAENALKKARALAIFSKIISVADDSGLEVDALNGAPGIYSARYAGAAATDLQNNLKLLNSLKDVPPERRGAAFKCVIAVVTRDGLEKVAAGECRGNIAFEMKGKDGFGYDPLFIPIGFDRTFAEIGPEIKNRISHRFKAIITLKEVLKKIIT